jgi:hypothetical protein
MSEVELLKVSIPLRQVFCGKTELCQPNCYPNYGHQLW